VVGMFLSSGNLGQVRNNPRRAQACARLDHEETP